MTKMAAMAKIAKTFKNLLQNQKTYDFETWHEASGRRALQKLYNLCHWDDLDLFYSKVNIGGRCILMGKNVKMSFEGTIGPLVLIFFYPKHRLWVPTRTASERNVYNLCFQQDFIQLKKSILHGQVFVLMSVVTCYMYFYYSHANDVSTIFLFCISHLLFSSAHGISIHNRCHCPE